LQAAPGFRARLFRRLAPWLTLYGVGGYGVSLLNQACTHLPWQVVLKTHAGSLDSFDREQTRRQTHSRTGFAKSTAGTICRLLPSTKVIWSALPQRSGDSALDWLFTANPPLPFAYENPERRRRLALPALQIKKEDQCQES